MTKTSERCWCSAIRKAARDLTELYDATLAPSGLLSTQFSMLRNIGDGTPTLSELAAILDLDRTTVGRNIRVLERSRLIKTSPGRDQRERIVALTPKGRKALRAALPLWKRAQRIVQRTMQRDEGFLSAFDRLNNTLSAK